MKRLLTLVLWLPGILAAQLTTGILQGTLRSPDGRGISGAPITIVGMPGVRTSLRSDSHGEFIVALPYGRYRVSAEQHDSVTVFVHPLRTTRVDFAARAAGQLRNLPPMFFNLESALGASEPLSLTVPVDFSGIADQRLSLESQRAGSWTNSQFKFMGMNATDSYQPGRPAILPDVQALDEVVVRSDFAGTASGSFGAEVGSFLAQPDSAWHGALSSSGAGSALASSNLPPPSDRYLLQQSQEYRWFTRDTIEAGGPMGKWGDIFAMGTAEWSSATMPLAPPGDNQESRLLYTNVRGRVRASPRDQFDALFSGSSIALSSGGTPAAIEELIGRRMSPSFFLSGGYQNQPEEDQLNFWQAGWTHELAAGGALELRYGYSLAHLNTNLSAGPQQSKIELLNGVVTGAAPLANFAVRPNQGIQGTWQPEVVKVAGTRHRILAGGGWNSASPLNRMNTPSGINLITADSAPAFVVRFNTPTDSGSTVRSVSAYLADHIDLLPGLTVDAGAIGDFSRGSVQGTGSDLIVWNSVSPRIAFAWQAFHVPGLVLRGGYSRLDSPLAGRYLDFGDPNSLSGTVYQWTDRNSDGVFQPGEEGTPLMRFGGAYSSISPSLQRPYADEIHVALELRNDRGFIGVHFFRRDDKHRIAALDVGLPAQAFTAVTVIDPFENQPLTVYQQNPATFGQDRYVLTNPSGLRDSSMGFVAEGGQTWRRVTIHGSFTGEKSYGPTNQGNSAIENDPGVIGALFLDPNTTINAEGRSFTDPAYLAKLQVTFRAPGGIEAGIIGNYKDGLVFGRELLVTGLAQGPFLVDATRREVATFQGNAPGYQTQYVLNWNLRIQREFAVRAGRIVASADVLNLANSANRIEESDISGPDFNQRLAVAILPARFVRLGVRWRF